MEVTLLVIVRLPLGLDNKELSPPLKKRRTRNGIKSYLHHALPIMATHHRSPPRSIYPYIYCVDVYYLFLFLKSFLLHHTFIYKHLIHRSEWRSRIQTQSPHPSPTSRPPPSSSLLFLIWSHLALEGGENFVSQKSGIFLLSLVTDDVGGFFFFFFKKKMVLLSRYIYTHTYVYGIHFEDW